MQGGFAVAPRTPRAKTLPPSHSPLPPFLPHPNLSRHGGREGNDADDGEDGDGRDYHLR